MLCYLYDGTFDGLLTCVFESYEKKQMPEDVCVSNSYQVRLGMDYYEIKTDTDKAARVSKGLDKNGLTITLYHAFLSNNEKRHKYIFDYMVLSFKMGAGVRGFLVDESVYAVSRIYKNVWNEAHFFKEFIRFKELKTGALYSKIDPKNNVLEIVVNHFMDRMPDERFIIHDEGRGIAAFYENENYFVADLKDKIEPQLSEEEIYYQELWKIFHRTIAIEERINKKLQSGNMPKRFWKNMLEMRE